MGSRQRLEKLTFEETTGQAVAFALYQFGSLRGVGKPLKKNTFSLRRPDLNRRLYIGIASVLATVSAAGKPIHACLVPLQTRSTIEKKVQKGHGNVSFCTVLVSLKPKQGLCERLQRLPQSLL